MMRVRLALQSPRPERRLLTSKVAAEDVALVDPLVGKKPIGRLGARPVLTGVRDALAHGVANLLQKLGASSAKTDVLKSGFVHLPLSPMRRGRQYRRLAPGIGRRQNLGFGCPPAHRAPRKSDSGARQGLITDSSDSTFSLARSANRASYLWVIESPRTPRKVDRLIFD